jgi:hypothetical protein
MGLHVHLGKQGVVLKHHAHGALPNGLCGHILAIEPEHGS